MDLSSQNLNKTTHLSASLLIRLLSVPFLVYITQQLLNFPTFKLELIIAITLYAIALSYWSKLWMIILPALLPVLDLTPWSGRILVTEFDFFIFSSITISLAFNRLDFTFFKTVGSIKWLILLLTISYSISTLIGYFSLKEIHSTDFHLYLTEYNSLRVAKGFFAALCFLPILAYEKKQGTPIAKILSIGIIIGFVLAIISIIWERLVFPGFFDFSNTYRISGLFSGLLLGGTMLDGYLLLAFPFFFILFYSFNKPWVNLLGIIIFTFGLYCILVTFTRTNYLAVSASILILAFGTKIIHHKSSKHPRFSYLIFPIIALLIAFSIFKGGYIMNRFSTTLNSFDHRLDHWSKANQLKHNGITAFLLGNGKGSYPNTYINNDDSGLTMARFWLQEERTKDRGIIKFIRLSPSDKNGTLNIIQRITINQSGIYKVNITLRNTSKKPQKLLVEFCKKNILKFKGECQWQGFTPPNNTQNWQTITKNLSSDGFTKGILSAVTPIDINILNRGLKNRLDIAQVEIIAPDGSQVLKNTQFKNNFDHWFFSSGNHMAWHIKNLWVSSFFEGGLIELALITILLIALSIRLYKQLREGNYYALAILASISGMMIVGLFGSIFDEPRISWLFFLITWLTILKPETATKPERTKNAWLYTLIGTGVVSSIVLGAGLYTIDKLDYTVTDVSSKFVEKAAKKLDIQIGGKYQAKLHFPPIKQWRGQGASPLYSKITTHYDLLDKPLPIPSNTEETKLTRLIQVNNTKQLLQALHAAEPGDGIELQIGVYSIPHNVHINKNATTYRPIILYAKELGNVLIEFNAMEGFVINASNWTLQNLMIKGDCKDHNSCDHGIHIIGKGDGTIIRNNIIYDVNSGIKGNGSPQKDSPTIYPDNVLIEKNTFTNTAPRNTAYSVTTIDVVGGNNWRIRANLISDFIKLHSDKTSYAAFLKGYGKKGIIEENLVICNMNLYKEGHTQLGLSLGGGGTGSQFCFDKKCEYEHVQGTIQNNIIMNCNDVGIYINKGKDSKIINNTLYNTAGIDVRFPESSALVINNIVNGQIQTRNKASLIKKNNLETDTREDFYQWFKNPDTANFSLLEDSELPLPLFTSLTSRDYCSPVERNKARYIGSTSTHSDTECLNILNNNLPILLTQFNEQAQQKIKAQQAEDQFYLREKKLKQEITVCKKRCEYNDLKTALKAIKTNGTIYIQDGVYEICGYIRRSVKIIGKPFHTLSAHLTRKSCDNKAALVINAPSVTLENLEISRIRVKDNNGACLRVEGKTKNLIIKNINCHDSQAGLISNTQTGNILLKDSLFERNGFNNGGIHNVSINSQGQINIINTKILSTREKGHSLQINAPKMLIDNSIIAALDGPNSRAIDNLIGGELTIRNSTIQQSRHSDNNEMIGFALGHESTLLNKQSITLKNNWLIFDRPTNFLSYITRKTNRLLKSNSVTHLKLFANTMVGMDSLGSNNVTQENNQNFKSREAAELADYDGRLLSVPILLSAQ